MAFKYAYAIASTNFDLAPVLKQYVATYPNGDLFNYQIVFTCEGDHHPDSRSYMIAYEHRTGRTGPTWTSFVDSYCTVNKLVAIVRPPSSIFPDISEKLAQISDHK